MGEQRQKTPYERVKEWMENPSMQDTLSRTLPRGANVQAWTTAALATVRTSKDIMKCEPLSIMGALMMLASLGLRLEGPLGQAYLQAREVKEKVDGVWRTISHECQAGIGYRGLMAIARRDPEVRDIEATIVHQADRFEFQRGTKMWLEHNWDVNLSQDQRGSAVAAYAAIRYRDGFYTFDVFPMGDILELRARVLRQTYIETEHTPDGDRFYRTFRDGGRKEIDPYAPGSPPWIGHPIPMIQKTAVRWASKYWSLTPEMDQATQLIAMDDAGLSQGLAQRALEVMPDHVRHAAEQATGIAADPNRQAAAATARLGQSMKHRMLAEARQVADGRPEPKVEDQPKQEEEPRAEMSDEDKQAALELERLEAKEFEQQNGSDQPSTK